MGNGHQSFDWKVGLYTYLDETGGHWPSYYVLHFSQDSHSPIFFGCHLKVWGHPANPRLAHSLFQVERQAQYKTMDYYHDTL